jgi:hypothetical protein
VGSATALATRPGNAAVTGLQLFPNPLTEATVVQFALAQAGPVELRVIDLLGRLVLPIRTASGKAGLQTLPLVPEGAARPQQGIYLVELRTAAGRMTSKVVIP